MVSVIIESLQKGYVKGCEYVYEAGNGHLDFGVCADYNF